jgi:acetyl-CoA acetyltransferase
MTAGSVRPVVAIAGAVTTGFAKRPEEVSQLELALDACTAVLGEVGLAREDIDGVVGTDPPTAVVQRALGIPAVNWHADLQVPFGNHLAAAVGAVASGICTNVLAYHAAYRHPFFSGAAARDPFRRAAVPPQPQRSPDTLSGPAGYAAWAAKYLHAYPAAREAWGRVAVNSRSNARANPAAALREPITLADHGSAPMVRPPLGRLDMDVPVDGADAFVVTSLERARDLPHRPVLVDAVTLGRLAANLEDELPGLHDTGQQVVARVLLERSEVTPSTCDLFYAYDGFTPIAVGWFEALGFCDEGEAAEFLRDSWDAQEDRLLLGGRVPVNSHGGSLSEGATQGSGHLREAVLQLQGRAGSRQVEGAQTALLGLGGIFFNSQGCVLRAAT